MDIKMKILVFAIDLLAPLIVGYFCRSHNIVKEPVFNKMILCNILVIYPALSFLIFWVLPLTYDLIWLPVMGLIMGLVPGILAYFVAEYKYTSDLDRGSYVMSAILSNLGTLGGLCVFLLYGETGYAYQQLVVLFQYILMFMFCYPLAQYYYQRSQKGLKIQGISIRSVLFSRNQLAIVGILCGVVLQQIRVPRPEALGSVVEMLIHIGAWTALLPVGYAIDFAKLKENYSQIKDITIIKFIFTPLVIYGLAHLFITNQIMINTLLVLAFMPTAINAVVTSRIYNLNIHISVAAFIVTTIVFLTIIYPLLFMGLSI